MHAPNKNKIVGYLEMKEGWNEYLDTFRFDRITDLILAFLNPEANGRFETSGNLENWINKAHSENCKIYFSIGGGNPPKHLNGLFKRKNLESLISEITNVFSKFNFDGIDIDLEKELINDSYNLFIHKLSQTLKPLSKTLIGTLDTFYASLITDATLNAFDWINIMSYDKTGPSDPDYPGPHAPFRLMEKDFTYFNKIRNIPPRKLAIGIPFYGYEFGNPNVNFLPFKQIIKDYTDGFERDIINTQKGTQIHYNGSDTIRQKVEFAKAQNAAGIMIWELSCDGAGKNSLLNIVNKTLFS